MMGREALHTFFRGPAPQGNHPDAFIPYVGRSHVLLLLMEDVPKDARVLEIGCGVGRNLAYLADHGYTNLEGVEINTHAVDLLRKTYPQLDDTVVHVGAAEDILPTLDGPYGLVFTVAVLTMIHPDSINIWDEICRLTDDVLAIEIAQPVNASRHYPHDLPALFGERGLTLESSTILANEPEFIPFLDAGVRHYGAWRFKRQ